MASHPERAESRAYRVVGRVQGVGFRQWTHRTATRLGVSGTVRNLPDGSVEVRAHGAAEVLSELETALRRGPIAARVDRVDGIPTTLEAPDRGFRIVS
ncbi:MAG: acylphosphatase [Gemmatimonadetes bacterium]|nr:acylphosphatase [Gemmatimonadota bacterium]